MRRLAFLGDGLRDSIETVAGTPAVDRDYQSSIPGLYFAGPAVAPTMGPVMRFVFGSDHAARTLAAASPSPATAAERDELLALLEAMDMPTDPIDKLNVQG